MNHTDRIFPTHKGLTTYLDELMAKNFQIPTFQRNVVWEQANVKKLWDSIYKFYPLGSILIWKTPLKLQNHRQVGGHVINDTNFERAEYQYILDGQQRTTSLLTSLYGGVIESKKNFNPTLFVDLTIPFEDETDDTSYKNRFLFWTEIDDKNGEVKQNIKKNQRYNDGLIVKLIDIKNDFTSVQKQVFNSSVVNQDFNHDILKELARIKDVLDNYRISLIEIKGIQVSEVCQIFERINQAGKPLNIFDIVVAKTFQPQDEDNKGFYLRELIDDFRKQGNSPFLKIRNLDYLQTIAVIVRSNIPNSGVRNITDRYLNELKTEHIIQVWEDTKTAILKTFDFFENHLRIKTPSLIPFRYFYFTISSYFYKNDKPDYEMLKKYFWFYSFHNEDLLSNTSHVAKHIEMLQTAKEGNGFIFDRFLIDKDRLRNATYSSKGRLSRAILVLFGNAQPKDWEHCDRDVIVHNLFFTTDKPNLHHIFPTNSEYVINNQAKNKITSDSLMNIAYLTQITNLDITNRNPLEYIKDYDKPEFEEILDSHFLSTKLLEWSRQGELPESAIDVFIEDRVNNILNVLQKKLSDIAFDVVDTNENQASNDE